MGGNDLQHWLRLEPRRAGGGDDLLDDMRLDRQAVVGDGGDSHADLERRDTDSLAATVGGHVHGAPVSGVVFGRADAARRLAGQADSRGVAEAETVNVVIELLRADLLSDPGGARVQALG